MDKQKLQAIFDAYYCCKGSLIEENDIDVTVKQPYQKETIFKGFERKDGAYIFEALIRYMDNLLINIHLPNSGRVHLITNFKLDVDELMLPLEFMEKHKLFDGSKNRYVLINRYPALSHHSFKVMRVCRDRRFYFKNSKVAALHPFILPPMNADCDGDQIDFALLAGTDYEEILPSRYCPFETDDKEVVTDNKEFKLFHELACKNIEPDLIEPTVLDVLREKFTNGKDEDELKEMRDLFDGRYNYKEHDAFCSRKVSSYQLQKKIISQDGYKIKKKQMLLIGKILAHGSKNSGQYIGILRKLAVTSEKLQQAALDIKTTGTGNSSGYDDLLEIERLINSIKVDAVAENHFPFSSTSFWNKKAYEDFGEMSDMVGTINIAWLDGLVDALQELGTYTKRDNKNSLLIRGKRATLVEALKKYQGKIEPTWVFFKRVVDQRKL
ncbi:MAG: hypothetical protein JNL74_15895 [Fibrobacteres bacterium]|nr:hypothetical protein [Fibrobacterota bacterium]